MGISHGGDPRLGEAQQESPLERGDGRWIAWDSRSVIADDADDRPVGPICVISRDHQGALTAICTTIANHAFPLVSPFTTLKFVVSNFSIEVPKSIGRHDTPDVDVMDYAPF